MCNRASSSPDSESQEIESYLTHQNNLNPSVTSSSSKDSRLFSSKSRVRSGEEEDEEDEASLNSSGYSSMGPLSPDRLKVLLEEDPGLLKKGWKKTRRKEVQKKLDFPKGKKTESGNSTEASKEDSEVVKQLDNLYNLQNSLEESEDEINDAEILRSVYTSVVAHQKNWMKRLLKK